MVVFNYTGRELSGKIVYYGPGWCGKTRHYRTVQQKNAYNQKCSWFA